MVVRNCLEILSQLSQLEDMISEIVDQKGQKTRPEDLSELIEDKVSKI